MRTVVVLAVGALALAACGQKSGGTAGDPQVSGPGTGSAAKLPADMPPWAAPMPGGKLDTVVAVPGGGGLFTFFTDAKPDAVIAHYAQQTTAVGMKNVSARGSEDTVFSSSPPGADTSKRLSVKAAPEDGRTRVDISYQPGA